MPIQCFIGEKNDKRIGAMWPVNAPEDTHAPVHWFVRLPNGGLFDIHSVSSSDHKPWDVVGEAPNFTVNPSINFHPGDRQHGWHGWLQNGVLSDDCEGRTYR